MSFKSNDTNHTTINLGNYEEFFILYMDNELTSEQTAAVDAFLAAHPDLQAELDLLMSTKLTPENIFFNKEDLLADQMKVAVAEEDLLLLIDGELSSQKAGELKKSIGKDKNLQLQHNLLLQAKLDPSETILYPNKQELYRRTEKTIGIGMWMRIAAVLILIASIGIIYLNNSATPAVITDIASVQPKASEVKKSEQQQAPQREILNDNSFASNKGNNKNTHATGLIHDKQKAVIAIQQKQQQDAPVIIQDDFNDNVIAYNPPMERSTSIDSNPSISGDVNTLPVTSDALPRNTDIRFASNDPEPGDESKAFCARPPD
jgi:hypothetical protein